MSSDAGFDREILDNFMLDLDPPRIFDVMQMMDRLQNPRRLEHFDDPLVDMLDDEETSFLVASEAELWHLLEELVTVVWRRLAQRHGNVEVVDRVAMGHAMADRWPNLVRPQSRGEFLAWPRAYMDSGSSSLSRGETYGESDDEREREEGDGSGPMGVPKHGDKVRRWYRSRSLSPDSSGIRPRRRASWSCTERAFGPMSFSPTVLHRRAPHTAGRRLARQVPRGRTRDRGVFISGDDKNEAGPSGCMEGPSVSGSIPPLPSGSTEGPNVSGLIPSGSTEEPSVSGTIPLGSTEEPSVSGTILLGSTEEPSVSGLVPIESTEGPSVSGTIPLESTEEPSVSGLIPIKSTEKPSVSGLIPSESTEGPSVSGTIPLGSTEETSVSELIPSESAEEPSVSGTIPSGSTDGPSVSGTIPPPPPLPSGSTDGPSVSGTTMPPPPPLPSGSTDGPSVSGTTVPPPPPLPLPQAADEIDEIAMEMIDDFLSACHGGVLHFLFLSPTTTMPRRYVDKFRHLVRLSVLSNVELSTAVYRTYPLSLPEKMREKWSQDVECAVCCRLVSAFTRPCCSAHVCEACLRQYFVVKVDEEGQIKIPCPNSDCRGVAFKDEITLRLPPDTKRKYERFLVDASSDPTQKTCPCCSHIAKMTPELEKQAKQEQKKVWRRRAGLNVTCAECGLVWCFPCHAPDHTGMSCKSHRAGDKQLRAWAHKSTTPRSQKNARRCPKCKVFTERTDGCPHMQCRLCKTDWCYECGQRRIKTRIIGGHDSRLSIIGCKANFFRNKPHLRRFIRGSIFGVGLVVAPPALALAVTVGIVALPVAAVGVPAYLIRRTVVFRRRRNNLNHWLT